MQGPNGIALRPVTPADHPFLLRLYASTRADELAAVSWSDAERQAFLAMQFDAQRRAYDAYENATRSIITINGADAGRLYVARWPEEMRIMDLALLPEFRNQGIGTALLRDLIREAAAATKRLSIHVEQFNPALRLYTRLGFHPAAQTGIYLRLEIAPNK